MVDSIKELLGGSLAICINLNIDNFCPFDR